MNRHPYQQHTPLPIERMADAFLRFGLTLALYAVFMVVCIAWIGISG